MLAFGDARQFDVPEVPDDAQIHGRSKGGGCRLDGGTRPVSRGPVYRRPVTLPCGGTSDAERVDLVRWIVAAITVHPGVKGMTGISDDRRTAETKQAAGLFADLLTVPCREEALDAFKFEGEVAFSAAFEVLGQVAMQTLISDPPVAAEMTKLGDHLDDNQLKSLFEGR